VIAFAIVSMIVAVVALVVIGIAREITARRALPGRTAER